jgi:hypothetical protein
MNNTRRKTRNPEDDEEDINDKVKLHTSKMFTNEGKKKRRKKPKQKFGIVK